MNHRNLLSIVLVAMMLAALAAPLAAQTPRPAGNNTAATWTPPRTPWGDPDLQGIYTSDDYINVGLQRQEAMGTRLYLTDEEVSAANTRIQNTAKNDAQEFANPNANVGTGPPSHWGERARRAPRQTSLIVEPEDGRMPALTPEGQARQAEATATRFFDPGQRTVASWENFTHYIRCISRGIAGSVLPVIYGNGTEIVQGPGYVAILQEMVHEARIIPLNGSPHPSSNIRSYMGDSRGRFEGNTLVIETTNLLGNKTGVGANGGGAPLSEAAKITERLTRIDKDTIAYEMRVEDPRTYTAPFKVAFPIRQEPGYQNFEYACHEGNNGMMNQLSAARAQERAAAEAAAQK
ncbi:MAG TPA: hypothetical protein VFR18_10945 [Terriglobia bacterium]|nr:hypothetical protein [Terriglobia bacterium]